MAFFVDSPMQSADSVNWLIVNVNTASYLQHHITSKGQRDQLLTTALLAAYISDHSNHTTANVMVLLEQYILCSKDAIVRVVKL